MRRNRKRIKEIHRGGEREMERGRGGQRKCDQNRDKDRELIEGEKIKRMDDKE